MTEYIDVLNEDGVKTERFIRSEIYEKNLYKLFEKITRI